MLANPTLKEKFDALLRAQCALNQHSTDHEWCDTCRELTENYARAYTERATLVNQWLGGEVVQI